MAKISKKENKFKSDMINSMTSDLLKAKKSKFEFFYNIIISNSDLGYKELVRILSDKLGQNFDRTSLNNFIIEMSKSYNSDKALKEINTIINLSKLRDKLEEAEDKDFYRAKIMLYEAKISKIKAKRDSIKKGETKRQNEPYKGTKENEERHISCVEEASSFVDRVLNGEDYTDSEFTKNNSFIKKYLKEFDQEKYVDYIIKHFKVESMSIEELKQLLEVVEFFKKNLEKNVLLFKKTDEENIDDIKNTEHIIVSGQEDLGSYHLDYPRRLFKWKLDKIEKSYQFYIKYENMLKAVIEKNDFSGYKDFTFTEKSFIDTQDSFIKDYYDNFINCNKANDHISGINTVNQKDYDTINNNFINKLIRREINK